MQVTQGRSRSFEITPISRTCVTMTSTELCSVSTQLASGLQAHHSANNCLASCLYNDGVVQAVTFAYLIYWRVSCFSSHRMCHSLLQSRKLKLGTHWGQSRQSTLSPIWRRFWRQSTVDETATTGIFMSHVMIQSLVTSFRYHGRRRNDFGVSFDNYSCSCCKETSPTQSFMPGARLDAAQATVTD